MAFGHFCTKIHYNQSATDKSVSSKIVRGEIELKLKLLIILSTLISANCFSAVEKSGKVKNVQIWGGIVKTAVCSSDNSCTSYWVSLSDSNGQSVLSMWLAAKMAERTIYIQGYDPTNPDHPYDNASKFYGMTMN